MAMTRTLVSLLFTISCTLAIDDSQALSQTWRACTLNVTLLDLQGRDYSVHDLCLASENEVNVGLRCVTGSRRGGRSLLNPCLQATPHVVLRCASTVDKSRQMSMLVWLQKGEMVMDTALHPLPLSPSPTDLFTVLPLTGHLSQTRFTVAVSQHCVTGEDSNLQPSTPVSSVPSSMGIHVPRSAHASALVSKSQGPKPEAAQLSSSSQAESFSHAEHSYRLKDVTGDGRADRSLLKIGAGGLNSGTVVNVPARVESLKPASSGEAVVYSQPGDEGSDSRKYARGLDVYVGDDFEQDGKFAVHGREMEKSPLVDGNNSDTFENDGKGGNVSDGSDSPTQAKSGKGDVTAVSEHRTSDPNVGRNSSESSSTSGATPPTANRMPATTHVQPAATPTTTTSPFTSSTTTVSATSSGSSENKPTPSPGTSDHRTSNAQPTAGDSTSQQTTLPPKGSGTVRTTQLTKNSPAANSAPTTGSVKPNAAVTTTDAVETNSTTTAQPGASQSQSSDQGNSSSQRENHITTAAAGSSEVKDSSSPSTAEAATAGSSEVKDSSSPSTAEVATAGSSEVKDSSSPSTAETSAGTAAPTTPGKLHNQSHSSVGSSTLETATAGNSSGLAQNPDGGDSSSGNSDTEDDTFWPIVAALVIGIPSIIVVGIAIIVIHRRRRVASPAGRLRVASMYH